MRRALATGARLAVPIALLALAWTKLDLDAATATLTGVAPAPAAAGCLLLLGGQVVCALRWRAVAARLGARASARWFAAVYLRGCFYGSVLPTAYGGDVVRVARASELAGASRAAKSVLIDRLAGFAVLAAVAGALLPFAGYGLPSPAEPLIAVACACLLTASALALWVREQRAVVGWGLAYVALWAGGTGLLALSLGVAFTPAALPAVLLVVGVAMALPVSIGAAGTREAGFVVALAPLGVGAPEAVALGIAFGLAVAVAALPGAPVPLPRRVPPELGAGA
jgi:hypothetical protein